MNRNNSILSYSSEFHHYFESRVGSLLTLDQTFPAKYLASDQYFDDKPTHSLITLQIIPNLINNSNDDDDDLVGDQRGDEFTIMMKNRVEKYIQASRKFKNNIPLMKCFEEVTDGGSTLTLHLCSFPFNLKIQSEMNNMRMIKEVFHRREDLITLEKYLESNYSLENDYGMLIGILQGLAKSLFELHFIGKLSHNSIIPRNVVISRKNSTALIGLPSFGLDDVVGTLNDEHLTYFSPQVLERFENGEKTVFSNSNDVYMFGTLIIRILLGEEFDAKYLDTERMDGELKDLKSRILKQLTNNMPMREIYENIADMAFRCIDRNESKRPSIAEAFQLLEKQEPIIILPSSESALISNSSSETPTFTVSSRSFNTSKFSLFSNLFGVKKKDRVPSLRNDVVNDVCDDISTIESLPIIVQCEEKKLDEEETKPVENPEDLDEEKKKLYIIDKRISEGASAVVFTLKRPSECVMKRYKKGHESDYKREIRCLQKRHQNIVTLIDNYSFKEGENFNHVIIMEYCGYGDLYRLVSSSVQKSAIKPIKFLTMGIQLFEALCHLHSNQYVHCDVKPVKLGDFAFSVRNGESSPGLTFHYAPPELHEGKPAIIECDVYSAACSLFEVLVKKKVSLKDKDFTQVWDQHNANTRFYSRTMSNPHAIRLFNLMKECLEPDAKNRCSSKKVLSEMIDIRNNFCATLIQKIFRGFRVRKSLKRRMN
ncbi:predicted protein [Naegleria gruberi]|uniref:Predicted protein n=1 Tax=Naegleria gruberi TaxID=5762 RepID=D2VRB5_NAEGR|nr:uncharacterized protein NAEGRDRAFT_71527 [Naegleria gruberi]EFC40579.1 predicted protein [Naegleria gruberi]|eukprot:XP_002673323.1 predicted protein [Naegleria gruberi strain NEG-M]